MCSLSLLYTDRKKLKEWMRVKDVSIWTPDIIEKALQSGMSETVKYGERRGTV